MNKSSKVLCIMLSFAMVLSVAGCNNNESATPEKEVSYREECKDEAPKQKLVDTDGQFEYKTVDWAGPDGYVIVVPNGDKNAKESAEWIKSYYSEKFKVSLSIVSDNSPAKDKEIIIGKAKRKEAKNNLAESEISVFLSGNKLVFSAGHYVTLDSAVQKFVRLAPEKGKAFTFDIKTDFVSTMLDGYKYVWGDEFEGSDINLKKWDFKDAMTGTTKMRLSYDKEIVTTADGRLKLHAIRLKDKDDDSIEFKVPYSVNTSYKMNYVYGYAEIRAKMPFKKGVWPSFWAQSKDTFASKKTRNPNYFTEIDIFEVFGSLTEVSPAIHKWYTDYDYVKLHDPDYKNGGHTSIALQNWSFPQSETLGNEYHTYGFEWTPTEIAMYVDGTKSVSYDITKSFDKNPDMSGFHDPIYLMFNFHVYASDYPFAGTPIEANLNTLPAEYYIDWFRLYQKPGQGALYTDTTVREYPNRK